MDTVFFTLGRGSIDTNTGFRLAKTVPAGSYVVEADVSARNNAGTYTPGLLCYLVRGGESPNFQTSFHRTFILHNANGNFSEGSMRFRVAFNHPGGEVAFSCNENTIGTTLIEATLLATKVASVG